MPDHLPDLGRREVVQRLLAGLGGIVAFPLVASAHPIQRHLRDASRIGIADAKANAPAYTPEFLDPHQLETLQALAERVVPGSTQAKSSQFIDQLLSVALPAEQRTFLQALSAFDGLAIARAGRPWRLLSEPQQNELLTVASTEQSGTPKETRESTVGGHVTIRDHFDHLKGWIVGAYYSSELGMRELGWTGNVFFQTFPGCDHPDGHG